MRSLVAPCQYGGTDMAVAYTNCEMQQERRLQSDVGNLAAGFSDSSSIPQRANSGPRSAQDLFGGSSSRVRVSAPLHSDIRLLHSTSQLFEIPD